MVLLGSSFTFISSLDRHPAPQNPLVHHQPPPHPPSCASIAHHNPACVSVCESVMPPVGYITNSSLTHMHSDATSVQLGHSRASSFPGLKRRQPFNPAGNESQIGKTLGGPIVGLCSTPLLIFSHASTSRHSTQRGNLKQERRQSECR